MKKLLSVILLVMGTVFNAYGAGGYILPDFHRLQLNGKPATINLGIYREGTLFLKFNESEYPIRDLEAFRRGTQQAMEDTQALLHGGENGRKSAPKTGETTVLLYDSDPERNERQHFTLAFDHTSTASHYPIKITFHHSTLLSQSFDFPPGELQYLQNTIDLILKNRAEYITKAQAVDTGTP